MNQHPKRDRTKLKKGEVLMSKKLPFHSQARLPIQGGGK